ncbi:ankyrin repeat domain-containing protein [candidate division KSB1 bacterium]
MKTLFMITIISFILNLTPFSFVYAQATGEQIINASQNYAATYLGGIGKEFCEAIALDDEGNVYVAGNTYAEDFPTTPGAYNRDYMGKGDVFIAKFDKDFKTLIASTLVGGDEGECAYDMLFDKRGYIYVVGYTSSENFPTTASAYDRSYNGGNGDTFILKMDKDLRTLASSTFLGGSGTEDDWRSPEIIKDGTGNIYIAGITDSDDFPTTPGAFREKYNGGSRDVFVSKFDPDLRQLLASTFVGGSTDDRMGRSLCIDTENGEVCIGGYTFSSDFPVSDDAYSKEASGELDGFVLKLKGDLSSMTASTILPAGWIYSMMIHDNGDIYVGGHANSRLPTTSGAYYTEFDKHFDQGFISRFSNDLSDLKSSTVLPGSYHLGGGAITCLNLAQSPEGDIISVGWTGPEDFPSTPGAFDETQNGLADIFITKMNKDLSDVLSSTFIGGSRSERWSRMTTDRMGNIFIASYTHSSDFPTTNSAAFEKFHEVINDEVQNLGTSVRDAFVIKIDKDLSAEVFEELYDAAKKDDLRKVRHLLSRNGDLLEKTDKYKRTALHSAARYGAVSVSEYLIEKGVDLNSGDEKGNSPLHLASLYGHDGIVELLVNSNADINAVNVDGDVPLSFAVIYGTPKSIGLLLSSRADGSIRDKEGNTLLHIATLYGYFNKVKEIMSYKPEIDIKNNAGNTALQLAVSGYRNEQLVEFLLEQGANPNVTDNTGKNPLHIASASFIRRLIESGAVVDPQDKDGNTPLHLALMDVLRFKSLPPFIKDKIIFLMEGGADPDIKNNEGRSPMDLAVESGDQEAIDLLKAKKKPGSGLEHSN